MCPFFIVVTNSDNILFSLSIFSKTPSIILLNSDRICYWNESLSNCFASLFFRLLNRSKSCSFGSCFIKLCEYSHNWDLISSSWKGKLTHDSSSTVPHSLLYRILFEAFEKIFLLRNIFLKDIFESNKLINN